MIIVCNYILLTFVALLSKTFKKNGKKMLFIFAFFSMFLISALRDFSVGTDTSFYVNVYNNYNSSEYYGFLFTHYEPLFRLTYQVFHYFNLSDRCLIMFISGVTIFNFCFLISRIPKNYEISLLIFASLFFPNTLNALRQYLAFSIALYALGFSIRGKVLLPIVFVILGSLFHISAVIMIVPLVLIKINKFIRIDIFLFLGVFFSIICLFFGNYVSSFALKFVQGGFYNSSDYYVSRIFRLTTFMCVLYFLSNLYFYIKSKHNKILLLYLTISSINLIFGFLYLYNEIFSRLIEIINLFLIFSIPYGLQFVTKIDKQLIIILGFFALLFLLINFVYGGEANIDDYKFFI